MSIASEISRISGNVADAYTAANAKGATMPVSQNSDNLATTISTIQTGTTPTGTKSITANGVYDVTDFASADVQVPTTAPAYYIEKTVDANGKLVNGSTIIDLTGVDDLGDYALLYAYSNNTSITGNVDFSSLTKITGAFGCSFAFSSCSGITSVDMSSLKTITGSGGLNRTFQSCSNLISVNLSSLTELTNQNACNRAFDVCTSLTTVDISSLTTISGGINVCSYMFDRCPITSIDLSSLTTITSNDGCEYMFVGGRFTSVDFCSLSDINANRCCRFMFQNCINLTRISYYALTPSSFGSYTNQFSSMLSGVTGCTVHFPMAIQSTIGSWSDITNGFGGTNTTVLFDIVTSLTGADSNTYTRKQKESTSTATAWTYNDTLYYTSGTTEPTVGDTIYSDSACTTAVTTISSIA